MTTLATILDQAAGAIAGREREREQLLRLVDGERPLVAFVHGLAGVGKTALLGAFAADARARGARVVMLDGRAVEPTEAGFVAALRDGAAMAGVAAAEPPSAAAAGALAGGGERVVLVLDTYELLGLLDDWLRRYLIPSLPANARVLVAAREPPGPAWHAAFGDLVAVLRLENLPPDAAVAMLREGGVDDARAARLAAFTRGHPLALRLAASAARQHPGLEVADAAIPAVVEALAATYLGDLDEETRAVVEAAALVRRPTASLLDAMVPEIGGRRAFELLRALPFVQMTCEGIALHDTMREVLATFVRAADPPRHRRLRAAAWRQVRREVAGAGRTEMWRYTADMLYLVGNPRVREAFFPSGAQAVSVEPAARGDRDAILAIAGAAADVAGAWWRLAPDRFRVARRADGTVAGFCATPPVGEVPQRLFDVDPFLAAVRDHLRAHPVPHGQVALAGRWQEAADLAARAALWLDIKRLYMELRPALRRVYLPVEDVPAVEPELRPLGFRPVAEGVWLNDFGPGSVDGWLADLAAAELLADEPRLEGRTLTLDGRQVELTRLEAGVLRALREGEGRPVARAALLRDVWGHQWTGGDGNLLEAVVSSLRKKLGDRASALETVRGVGYRLGPLG